MSRSWAKIAEVMPGRTAKQCRERYNNHVDPAIKKDKIWTAEEDALVMQLHAEHHNQFAKIARRIPGRCYDDVKNRYVPGTSQLARLRLTTCTDRTDQVPVSLLDISDISPLIYMVCRMYLNRSCLPTGSGSVWCGCWARFCWVGFVL